MSKKKIAAFAAAVLMTCGIGFSGASAALSPFDVTSVEASAADYSNDTKGFVTRMYDVVLGRKPDTAGLNNWTKKLNNHTATAADIINGFFLSDEYKNADKSYDDIVADCYKAMLDRSPDSEGKSKWWRCLKRGMTVQAVCKGFVGSSEFQKLCKKYGITPGDITLRYVRDENYERTDFVYRLYRNCLGRFPDTDGLENWCKNLKKGVTGSEAVKGFIFSKEYRKLLYSESSDDKPRYVAMLYNTLLGREADTAGLNNWVDQLKAGRSYEFIANGFLFSNEFKSQCEKAGIKVGNKIAAPEDEPLYKYPAEAIALVNKARAEKGLPALKVDRSLTKAAEVRAKEAIEQMAKIRSERTARTDLLKEYGAEGYKSSDECTLTSKYVPTNDLYGSPKLKLSSPNDFVQFALDNEVQKEKLLSSKYKYVGAAVVCNEQNDRVWSLIFTD